MSNALEKNVKILHQEVIRLQEQNRELADRIITLEAGLGNLASDQANLKQLVGYAMGRGTGSTVHGG